MSNKWLSFASLFKWRCRLSAREARRIEVCTSLTKSGRNNNRIKWCSGLFVDCESVVASNIFWLSIVSFHLIGTALGMVQLITLIYGANQQIKMICWGLRIGWVMAGYSALWNASWTSRLIIDSSPSRSDEFPQEKRRSRGHDGFSKFGKMWLLAIPSWYNVVATWQLKKKPHSHSFR